MKKLFISFIIILFSFNIYSQAFKLKDKIIVNKDKVLLNDMIIAESRSNVPNIVITDNKDLPKKINADNIIEILFSKNIYDITLIGKEIFLYPEIKEKTFDRDIKKANIKLDPIISLEKHFRSFVDNSNLGITVALVKIDPFIDISSVEDDYKWEIKKIGRGLKDLEKIKYSTLIIRDKKYRATIDVKIFADIWIAGQNYFKNDLINKNGFLKKNVDVTSFENIDTLVYDISKTKNTIFNKEVGTGEVLRWTSLKKLSLVKKGESIKLILKRDNIKITLPCTVMTDGFENEKVKIKLLNGKERFGVLRKKEGMNYVEIL